MDSDASLKLLIGGLGMLACGIVFLIVAVLMARRNATAWKWFGISVKFQASAGIIFTVGGLINLGRLIVPPTLAETYATLSLAAVVLLIVGLIGMAIVGRRAK